jgi:hypothetical protein
LPFSWGGAAKLAVGMKTIMDQPEIHSVNTFASLWYLIIPFVITWLYSVIDAFWTGRKLDETTEEGIQ